MTPGNRRTLKGKPLARSHRGSFDRTARKIERLLNQLQSPIRIATDNVPFDLQAEMLRKEYDLTKEEIRELSRRSQACRNWSITLWAGSIAFAATPDQGNALWLIIISAIFPAIFWVQDTYWTQTQRIFIFRNKQITDFFASDRLKRSMLAGELVDFSLDGFRKDTTGELSHDSEYLEFSSFFRVFFFRTNVAFYLPLIVI